MKNNKTINFSVIVLKMSCIMTLIFSQAVAQEPQKTEIMQTYYIGTYTQPHEDGQSKGIYSVFQDPATGALEMGANLAEVSNPSFVKRSRDGKNLYAVSELSSGTGFVYSYKINSDGSLRQIGKLSSEGSAPCHLAVDATDRFVFVSNYLGGVVTVYERKNDGSLETRQVLQLDLEKTSHAHSLTLSPDNRTAYIADLGNDRIWLFYFDASEGLLEPHVQPFIAIEPGAGPRHFAMDTGGKTAYSINELNSTLTVFEVQKNGGLDLVQNISSLPPAYSGENAAADIHIHPSGKFLYVSNRGHNSIAVFGIGEEGRLQHIGFQSTAGEWPRNFAIGKKGKFLYVANQHSNSITAFRIDETSGRLKSHSEGIQIINPVCIEF